MVGHQGSLGYVLDEVPYGFVPRAGETADPGRLAFAHAAALGFVEMSLDCVPAENAEMPVGLHVTLQRSGPGERGVARSAARQALALTRLRDEQPLSRAERAELRRACPPGDRSEEIVIQTDGSADKGDGTLGVGYTLGALPYGLLLADVGHETIAEHEAIRIALLHAQLLGYRQFRIRSDHLFHVRRYDEDLVYRGRPKSQTLERLDGLVAALGPDLHFEYASTLDTDAPHRLALHARALQRLAIGEPLSRAQLVAIRRVHHGHKRGGALLF